MINVEKFLCHPTGNNFKQVFSKLWRISIMPWRSPVKIPRRCGVPWWYHPDNYWEDGGLIYQTERNREVEFEVDSVAVLLSQEEVIDYESDESDTFQVSLATVRRRREWSYNNYYYRHLHTSRWNVSNKRYKSRSNSYGKTCFTA